METRTLEGAKTCISEKLSPFDIPGGGIIYSLNDLVTLQQKLSEKFDIDEKEIYIGRSSIPPEIPTCLVYIEWSKVGSYLVYFRKKLKSDGRWVCLNYMHHVKVDKDSEKAGTYDYRNNIAYIPREDIPPFKVGIS